MTAIINEGMSGQGNLLEAGERQAIHRVAAWQPPHSQRAQALLALDKGVSQATAAAEAGLTVGQVKYWLRKFRKGRLSIFPKEGLSDTLALSDESVGNLPEELPAAAADTADEEAVSEAKREEVEVTSGLVQPTESSQEEQKPPKMKKRKKADKKDKDKSAGKGKGKKSKGKIKGKKSKAKAKGKKKKSKGKKNGKKKSKKAKDGKRKKDKKRKGKKKKKKG